MRFRLLGPLEVWHQHRAVSLGGTKPKTLLAALLLENQHVVPTARLVDVVWGEDPPGRARSLIQSYVFNLRQALAAHGQGEVIVTKASGYAIRVPGESIDVGEADALRAQARQAAAAGSPERAAELLRVVVGLWRGPSLAGLENTLLAGEAARLDEMRVGAWEELFTAELALGRHDGVLAELTSVAGRHPVNERLRGLLMVALYRSGRQSQALDCFRNGRELLIDQLGVEPGPELSALHGAILRGEADLLGPPRPVPAAAAAVPDAQPGPVPAPGPLAEPARGGPPAVPRQTPPVPTDFTGRQPEITALVSALTAPRAKAAMTVHVIAGRGGCGKSALATRVAHEVAASFPDGQLFAELRGLGDVPAEPADVLGRFLRALGLTPTEIPDGGEERAERFRSLVNGRRVLIVLDDAGSEQQVRPLLPGGAGCAVVVTSRDRLSGMAGASLVELDVLDADGALELLTRIVGAQRVAAEPVAARDIIERCGHLPLAIRVAGARLAARRGWPLKLLAERLADECLVLDELAAGDLEVRASLALSYRALDEHARVALRRLGFLGVPSFSSALLSALLEVREHVAADVLEELVDAHLLEFAGVDAFGEVRYQQHDLSRLYGRERAEAEESTADLAAAVTRVLRGLLSTVDAIDALSPSGELGWRDHADGAVADPVTRRALSDPYGWFETEQTTLVIGVERAAALGLVDIAVALASQRWTAVLAGANQFAARNRMIAAALAAAGTAGERRAEAVMRCELGQLRYDEDRYTEARPHFQAALGMFQADGDVRGEVSALTGLGGACRESGRLAEALHFLERAATLLAPLADDQGVGYVRRLAGSVRLELGDFPGALADLDAAEQAYERAGSRRGVALTLRTRSLYHRARGELAEALALSVQARDVFAELGDRLMVSYAVRAIAKSRIRLGEGEQALEPLLEALATCRTVGDRWGEGATLRVVGELHLDAGRLAEAEAAFGAALLIWAALDLPLMRARAERDVATMLAARGDAEAAEIMRASAVKTFSEHGAREFAELTAA